MDVIGCGTRAWERRLSKRPHNIVILDALNPKVLTHIVHVPASAGGLGSFIAAAFIHQPEGERKEARYKDNKESSSFSSSFSFLPYRWSVCSRLSRFPPATRRPCLRVIVNGGNEIEANGVTMTTIL